MSKSNSKKRVLDITSRDSQKLLKSWGACDFGKTWFNGRTARKGLEECTSKGYMMWFLGRLELYSNITYATQVTIIRRSLRTKQERQFFKKILDPRVPASELILDRRWKIFQKRFRYVFFDTCEGATPYVPNRVYRLFNSHEKYYLRAVRRMYPMDQLIQSARAAYKERFGRLPKLPS